MCSLCLCLSLIFYFYFLYCVCYSSFDLVLLFYVMFFLSPFCLSVCLYRSLFSLLFSSFILFYLNLGKEKTCLLRSRLLCLLFIIIGILCIYGICASTFLPLNPLIPLSSLKFLDIPKCPFEHDFRLTLYYYSTKPVLLFANLPQFGFLYSIPCHAMLILCYTILCANVLHLSKRP